MPYWDKIYLFDQVAPDLTNFITQIGPRNSNILLLDISVQIEITTETPVSSFIVTQTYLIWYHLSTIFDFWVWPVPVDSLYVVATT